MSHTINSASSSKSQSRKGRLLGLALATILPATLLSSQAMAADSGAAIASVQKQIQSVENSIPPRLDKLQTMIAQTKQQSHDDLQVQVKLLQNKINALTQQLAAEQKAADARLVRVQQMEEDHINKLQQSVEGKMQTLASRK